MPRKGAVPKRDVLPDPVYNSKTVTRFINKIMLSCKKSVAQGIVYALLNRWELKRAKTIGVVGNRSEKCNAGARSPGSESRRGELSVPVEVFG